MRRNADASLMSELLELRAECRLARCGDMFVVLLPELKAIGQNEVGAARAAIGSAAVIHTKARGILAPIRPSRPIQTAATPAAFR